ncbi:MAG TPA: hypothetical protein VIL01_09725 [Thermomicrobiales bacterium]|mgnify:CR=1 FL=1
MFGDRDNLIGLLFLALCAVVAGALIWEIVTGNRFRYSGPTWLVWVLAIIVIGGSIYGLIRGGAGRSWPNPQAGRRPWWRRLFQRDSDDPRI